MFYFYAISSLTKNYIYLGISNDIERRVHEHNSGQNKTTKPYRPFVLFHKERFKTRTEARNREKYLKSGVGKEYLKMILATV